MILLQKLFKYYTVFFRKGKTLVLFEAIHTYTTPCLEQTKEETLHHPIARGLNANIKW